MRRIFVVSWDSWDVYTGDDCIVSVYLVYDKKFFLECEEINPEGALSSSSIVELEGDDGIPLLIDMLNKLKDGKSFGYTFNSPVGILIDKEIIKMSMFDDLRKESMK